MPPDGSASLGGAPLSEYRWLDEEIDLAQAQQDDAYDRAMSLRWMFGKTLAAERVNGRLPVGRLDEVAEGVGKSRGEIDHRMKFFETYPTEEDRCNALQHRPPWRDVVASLTREPRRRQEMVEADGDGDAPDTRSALVEVVRAYRGNQDTLARRRQEHDDDIRRHGPSPSSRPVFPEAERLCDGLRGMEAGAEKVRKLIELAPLVGLAPEDLLERLVAELPPNTVRRQGRDLSLSK